MARIDKKKIGDEHSFTQGGFLFVVDARCKDEFVVSLVAEKKKYARERADIGALLGAEG